MVTFMIPSIFTEDISFGIATGPREETVISDLPFSFRSDVGLINTPKWEPGDYWVLVRDSEDISLDESDDQMATFYIHDEKKFSMVGTETISTAAGTFDCYKLQLIGIIRASGDGVQSLGGIKVSYHFDLDATVEGTIWIRTTDFAFVKLHYTADGDAQTNTVLGEIHQHQDLYIEYDQPEETFGFPISPGLLGSYMNDVYVTGTINIEGQTNGDESVNENHHVDTDRNIGGSTFPVLIPSGTYDSGTPYPLGGRNFKCLKITGTDSGGSHNDGDSIDPPRGGTMITYFSPEVGFYVKQEVRNLWTAWSGVNEYTVQSTEILADYSYRSVPPVIEDTHADPLLNDGLHQGNLSVKITDEDGISDITEVSVDLSSLGLGDKVIMYDQGTNGDEVEMDGIYTLTGITTTTEPLTYSLPVTVKDWSGNEISGSIEIRVSDFRDLPPLATEMKASPATINNDEVDLSLFTVEVEDDNGISEVSVDLEPLGGEPDVRMYDDGTHGDARSGDNIYSLEVNASPSCAGGVKLLKVNVMDTGNNEISGFISLMVLNWNKPPEILPHSVGRIKNDGEDTTVISATVQDDEGNLENIHVDLSSIGGNSASPMYDDGTHGDAVSRDSIFSLEIRVGKNYTDTQYLLNVTATDSAGASSSASIYLEVQRIGSAPELSNVRVSSNLVNDGEDIVRISVDYYDRDGNINRIMIDLGPINIAVPKGMLMNKGVASINISVGPTVPPGTYNLTITVIDLDWKTASIQVELVVISESDEDENMDTDEDGIPDWWEKRYGLDSEDPSDANEDWNDNGRTNLEEYINKQNPLTSGTDLIFIDSDYDGMPDWWESHYGLDPYNSNDAQKDDNRNSITNLAEYFNGTNPKYKSGIPGHLTGDTVTMTTVTEGELERRMDNLLLIMLINGVFLVFAIILFLLERRWRKRSIMESDAASQKDFVELEKNIEKKLMEQNELIKDLIDVINEASLLKEKKNKYGG